MTTYSYSDANRLTLEVSAAGSITYSYDAAGNQTKTQEPVASFYYDFDAPGHLTTAQVPAGVVTFIYNADGQRVGKQSYDGSVYGFVFDHNNPLERTDGAGGTDTGYTALVNEPFGDLVGQWTPAYGELQPQFDALMNANTLVNASGQAIGPVGYSAFGLPASSNHTQLDGWANLSANDWGNMSADDWETLPVNPLSSNLGFGGQKQYYQDVELDLYLMGGGSGNPRHYNPRTGRFLSEDPIRQKSGEMNLYPYVGNDPVNNVDPSGHVGEGINHWYPLYLGGAPIQEFMEELTAQDHQAFHNYFAQARFGPNHNESLGGPGMTAITNKRAREIWRGMSKEERNLHLAQAMRAAGKPESFIQNAVKHIQTEAVAGVDRSNFRISTPLAKSSGDARTQLRMGANSPGNAMSTEAREELELKSLRGEAQQARREAKVFMEEGNSLPEVRRSQENWLRKRRDVFVAQAKAGGRDATERDRVSIRAIDNALEEVVEHNRILKTLRLAQTILPAFMTAVSVYNKAQAYTKFVDEFSDPENPKGAYYKKALEIAKKLEAGEDPGDTNELRSGLLQQHFAQILKDTFSEIPVANVGALSQTGPQWIADNLGATLANSLGTAVQQLRNSDDRLADDLKKLEEIDPANAPNPEDIAQDKKGANNPGDECSKRCGNEAVRSCKRFIWCLAWSDES